MLGHIKSYNRKTGTAVIVPAKESGLPDLRVTERHQILMNEEQIKPGQAVIFSVSHGDSGPIAIHVQHGSYASAP